MNKPIDAFKGTTIVHLITPIDDYPLTENERLVWMVDMNTMGDIKGRNLMRTFYFMAVSKSHAIAVKNQNMITIIISIIAIWVVALAATPMLAQF